MPANHLLWMAGLKVPEIHCYFVGDTGKLDRVTLIGVIHAATLGLQSGVFGGEISPAQIGAAYRNPKLQSDVFVDYVWRKSGGDPGSVRRLVKASVDHDAVCLNKVIRVIQSELDLSDQQLMTSRDESGHAVVLKIPKETARERARELDPHLKKHIAFVSKLLELYKEVEQKLNHNLSSRPVSQLEKLPKSKSPADPKHDQVGSNTAKLKIDISPIEKAYQETQAAIEVLKARCLRKAAIECG